MSQFLEIYGDKISPEPNSGCWLWTGTVNQYGYGRIVDRNQKSGHAPRGCCAHRVAYLIDCGPIPEGFQVDHLCRVRSCCNPSHLEAVTAQENVRRALAYRPATARPLSEARHFCIHGHDVRASGSYAHPHGFTVCRQCKRDANQRSYFKNGRVK